MPCANVCRVPFTRLSSTGDGGGDTPDQYGEYAGLDNWRDRLDVEAHQEMLSQYAMVAAMDRQVAFVIQPFLRRFGSTTDRSGRVRLVRKEEDLLMQETLALVDTLGWKVAGHASSGLRSFGSESLFGSGMLDMLKEKLSSLTGVTVVFVSIYQLKAGQRAFLEDFFGLPIIDRYNLVLQIFQRHACTREARLQVSLAEIPYLKQRLHGDLYLENRMKHSGRRRGNDFFEAKIMALKRQEGRIKSTLDEIRRHRKVLREKRSKYDIPTVAVVGYTNSGKTSLIKALTGSESLTPRNQVGLILLYLYSTYCTIF